MGGGPCRLKGILDGGVAANRGFECMRNTAAIAAAATSGAATVGPKTAEMFLVAADGYAKACADVEKELGAFLPADP